MLPCVVQLSTDAASDSAENSISHQMKSRLGAINDLQLTLAFVELARWLHVFELRHADWWLWLVPHQDGRIVAVHCLYADGLQQHAAVPLCAIFHCTHWRLEHCVLVCAVLGWHVFASGNGA